MSRFATMAEQERLDQLTEAEIRQSALDRKAERKQAAADAEAARKQADADAKAARKQAVADAKAQRKAQTKARRKATRENTLAALPDIGMSALWASMIVLPITLAWKAQELFARTALHLPAPMSHGFPAAVELGAWLCAFEAHRRARAGLPTGSLTRWMWVLALIAAGINFSHGLADGGPAAGIALSALSLLGVLLHSIRQGLDAAAAHSNPRRALALVVWRRVRYPRLSLAAASIRAAREIDAATAWTLAWLDRYGVGPDATRRERILGRLIIVRELGIDKDAASCGDLSIIDGRVKHALAPEVIELLDAERAAATHHAEQAKAEAAARIAEAQAAADERIAQARIEAAAQVADAQARAEAAQETARQHQADAQAALDATAALYGPDLVRAFGTGGNAARKPLSNRAAEVLPELRAAIETGDLSSTPTTREVIDWWRVKHGNGIKGIGAHVAGELSAEIKRLHLVPATSTADEGQDDETERAA